MSKTASRKTQPSQQDSAPATSAEETEALSRVREILFGQTVRQQSEEIQELQHQFELEVAALRAECELQLESLKADVRREVEAIRWQLNDLGTDKLARRDLSAMLTEVAEKLTTAE